MGAVDERATRRSNGSVRVRLPESRPAASAPASRGRVVEDTRGADGSIYGMGRAIRRGVTGAIGGVLPDVMSRALSAFSPTMAAVGSLVGSQSGRVSARNLMEGIAGTPEGGVRVPVVAPAAPAATAAAAALAAGSVAQPSPISPNEEMMRQRLAAVMKRPMTLRGAQAVAGLLPAPRQPAGAKDSLLATTAAVSEATYASEVKDIAARRAAGELDLAAARAETKKATDAYFMRNTALVSNPLNYAQANMLTPDDVED